VKPDSIQYRLLVGNNRIRQQPEVRKPICIINNNSINNNNNIGGKARGARGTFISIDVRGRGRPKLSRG
jgi:hypothetical protein